MKKTLLALFFIFLTIPLSGCGFHLRGYEPLPPQLKVIYLQTSEPYSAFIKQLKKTLYDVGVLLTENSDQSAVTLEINSAILTQTPTNFGSNGQVTTYLLTYTVTFQLLDRHGKTILGPESVTTTSNYSITSNQILGDMNAQQNLESDLRRDAIYQLLSRLRSYSTMEVLQNLE